MTPEPPAGVEGAARVCQVLEKLGITHVFGLPGTQTVPLYEAIRTSALTSIVPTSELSAAFMAGAYFRSSGRVAALATIPGPGFTWALTGVAEARADSAALLHLTLAEPEGPRSRFELQAIPQRTVGSALAKGFFTVRSLEEIGPVLEEAHALAVGGEPGPVIVALSGTTGEAAAIPEAPVEAGGGGNHDVSLAWLRLTEASRPLLYVGQGALTSAPIIRRLAEELRIPVMATPSGRGILAESHPLSMPFDPCRGGHAAAKHLLQRADLVLVLGARLGHNGSAGHGLPLDPSTALQVDAAPENCGAAYGIPGIVARIEEWADVAPWGRLAPSQWDPAELDEARRTLRWPGGSPTEPRIAQGSAEEFFTDLRKALPESGRLVTDTGLHQILTRRYFDVLRPGGLLLPSDFQSMGFGLPAAMGAKLANPSDPVVGLVGDGSLAMNGLELATAAHLRICLPVVVFVDGHLNQIRVQQQREFGHVSGVDLPALDPEALAEAVGVEFAWVETISEALTAALGREGPTLLAVPVGDSPAMKKAVRRRRIRNAVKKAVGRRALGWFRQRKS